MYFWVHIFSSIDGNTCLYSVANQVTKPILTGLVLTGLSNKTDTQAKVRKHWRFTFYGEGKDQSERWYKHAKDSPNTEKSSTKCMEQQVGVFAYFVNLNSVEV